MRLGCIFAVVIAVALSAAPALATSQQDSADCDQGADVDRSIAGCTRVLKDPKSNKKAVYYNRGKAYVAKGDFDRAIADYNELIRLVHKQPLVFNARGFAYASKGDWDRAIADYNESIRLDPKQALVFVARGLAYKKKGRAGPRHRRLQRGDPPRSEERRDVQHAR